jgi:hypothetical protein
LVPTSKTDQKGGPGAAQQEQSNSVDFQRHQHKEGRLYRAHCRQVAASRQRIDQRDEQGVDGQAPRINQQIGMGEKAIDHA